MKPAPPEPHLSGALRALASPLNPGRVEQVWIFPPRRAGPRETGLVVLVAYNRESRDRRDVVTLHYEAEPGNRQFTRRDTLSIEGSMPEARVERLITGILRRLGEAAEPRRVQIGGDPARWEELLQDLVQTTAGGG